MSNVIGTLILGLLGIIAGALFGSAQYLAQIVRHCKRIADAAEGKK